MKRLLWLLPLVLAACSSTPPPPDWQMNARSAMDSFVQAYMTGNTRVEEAEFARARQALASTGRADLIARAELLRCAARVASLANLAPEPCAGFEALRTDASPPERAYADYLSGKPADAALLPPAQRNAALSSIEDPFSRLLAAGVAFQAGRANTEVIQQAVDAASAQGWRRPLLTWLGVQAQRAESAGAADEAARIRRRMALVGGER